MEPTAYTAKRAFKNHRDFTFQNWSNGGEIMHYAFLHMPEFFRHAVIHRGCGPISELASDPRNDLANLPVETDLGSMTLDEYVQAAPVNGVVIVQGGSIVYERYPRMRPFDKHLLMSVSKIFASTVIAILEDRGQVEASKPVDGYISELAGSGWEGVSVRDVLDMASGIDCLEVDIEGAYSDPATGFYQYEASLDWLARTEDTWDSTYDYVASLRRGREPGTLYQYTSLNTFVLSWLAERITGRPMPRSSRRCSGARSALRPTRCSRSPTPARRSATAAFPPPSATWPAWACSSPPSWSVVADERIVSEAYVDKIQRRGRPHIVESADDQPPGLGFGDERPRHSCYQWNWVMDDGDFNKGGFGGQGLYISPARDLVIAYAGTTTSDGVSNKLRWIARQVASSGVMVRR